MYFTLTAHLDSDAKFSLKIFYLYFDIIIFAVEKQIHIPELIQTTEVFQITESIISFYI